MVDYGKVKSTVKPEPIVVDEFSVWVHADIQPVSENVGTENEFVGFEYSMAQYGKDEYIQAQAERNAALEDNLTDTQLALCEVYEMLG